MMFNATLVTPMTVAVGWFWKIRLNLWRCRQTLFLPTLGTLIVLLFIVQAVWRGWLYSERKDPNLFYFLYGIIVVGALAYQGNLGGTMVFG